MGQLPLPDETVEVHATRTLAVWIAEKRAWIDKYFGTDMWALEGDEFADALRTHVLALIVEAGELLQETKWKTWTTERGRPDEDRWNQALFEYADMMQFMANIAIIMRFTGTDIDRALDKKFEIITRRQTSGSYTGISEKCKECGR